MLLQHMLRQRTTEASHHSIFLFTISSSPLSDRRQNVTSEDMMHEPSRINNWLIHSRYICSFLDTVSRNLRYSVVWVHSTGKTVSEFGPSSAISCSSSAPALLSVRLKPVEQSSLNVDVVAEKISQNVVWAIWEIFPRLWRKISVTIVLKERCFTAITKENECANIRTWGTSFTNSRGHMIYTHQGGGT